MKGLKLAALVTSIALSSTTQASLTDGLIAYYPFNGNANDETGYGYHGTVYGAILTMDRFGDFSSAYYFDGIEDSIIIQNNPLLNPAHITLSAWVNVALDINHDLSMDIISKDGEKRNRQFLLNENGEGRFRAHIGTAVGDFHYFDSEPVERGKWHHVVQTYDGESLNLYVDGEPQFPEEIHTVSGGSDNSSQPIRIGGGAPERLLPLWFRGMIDDVRIYNRSLSALEVQQLFRQESPTELHQNEVQNDAYDQGYQAAVAQCKNDPESCGITISSSCPASPSFSERTGILNIPMVESSSFLTGTTYYRVNMSLVQSDELLFAITDLEQITP